MDTDASIPHTNHTTYPLHPTNALAGPSTVPDHSSQPTLFLPPPAPPRQRPYFSSTDDLLARFQLLPAYERYVRPFVAPTTSQLSTPGAIDKGKGKEKEVPPSDISSPAVATPAPPNEAEDDELHAKGERKWKNSYKHMIKGIPGKHSMKKDDHLVTMMQIPPKQRSAIHQFDLRTQREAFSVSLEGLKGWNINALVAETPQAREDRRKRKELKKLAKAQALASSASPLPGHSATPAPISSASPGVSGHPQARTSTPKPGPGLPNRAISQPQNASQIRSRTPVGIGTPRSVSTPGVSQNPPPPIISTSSSAPTQLHQVSTPAATPNAGPDATAYKRSLKREREDSTSGGGGGVVNGNGQLPPPSALVNGVAKPHINLGSKAGTNGIRPRPVKKQRMDSQGQAREMPIQQPTPHT